MNFDRDVAFPNKFKVIDLLNKIANEEEVPKKIKWDYEEWEYIEEMKDYYSFNRHIHLFNTVFPNDGLVEHLNDEIEIIEEEKEIEKGLKLYKEYLEECDVAGFNPTEVRDEYIDRLSLIVIELIDEVKKLKEKK